MEAFVRAGLVLTALAFAAPSVAQAPYTGGGAVLHSSTGGVPQDIPATLLKPAGDGPFPAVVILHDCSGLGGQSSGAPGRWGSLLAGQGYVVVIPDSFLPRGLPDGVCTVHDLPSLIRVGPGPRTFDAYAALDFLRSLPYVDGRHVGLMGGSHGGSSTLSSMTITGRPEIDDKRRHGFAAAVALYPGCGARYGPDWRVTRQGATVPVTEFIGTYQPAAPLRILIGERDDWTPAEHCRVLAERSAAAGYPVTIKIYPGAYHSFDSPNPPRYLPNRHNVNKPDGHGATTGGDPRAWEDSVKEVTAFFAARLKGGS
jgi:dienelactone hydrolase